MRQIGSLTKRADAERFAAYLITAGITAHAEADGDEWAIWVRDENRLDDARDAYEDFKRNPEESRYRGVERTAAELRREEAAKREAARKHVVEMRGKWGRGGGTAKRAPLVFVLIGLCVMASLWTKSMNLEAFSKSKEAEWLKFASRGSLSQLDPSDSAPAFVDIRQGEVWRLITPIFMHAGVWHLVMNAFWLYYFGAQIEHFQGSLRLGLIVLAAAVISNVVQAITDGPFFLGISGVVTALFGYVWIKSKYDPSSRLFVTNFTIGFFVIYLFYCLFRSDEIANSAHFVGLGVGAIIAYLPLLVRSSGKH